MKKLILLTAIAVMGVGATAQQSAPLNVGGPGAEIANYHLRNTDFRPGAKSTIAGTRWYNHAAAVDILTGGATMDFNIFPIWYDSTVKQNFLNGFLPINYIGAAQIIDPIHFTLYNNDAVYDPNIIAIKPESVYSVDSIAFSGAYVKNISRPTSVVDTLIFSVSQATYGYYYGVNPAQAWAIPYVAVGDTLKGYSVMEVDVPNRASAHAGAVVWKVPLTDADREEDSSGFVTVTNFAFPVMVNGVPGSVDIPAGRGVAVTVTFKTGDNVIPNVDTFSEYHHLFLFSGEALGQGGLMPYYNNAQYRDRNASSLMFFDNEEDYIPSIIIEGQNSPDFFQEFHDISAHIVCNDCPTVAEYSSVHNVNSPVATEMNAYPNPASNEINVSFALNQNTNATVSVTNAVGQVIAVREVSGVVANQNNVVTFSTAGLSAGIYFYTVEAKGQRTTSRFVVSH